MFSKFTSYVLAAVLLGTVGVASAANLPVPAGYPALLGVSCGGVAVTAYITGFNTDGNPTGELVATTRCGGSGRGGGYKSHTYTSITSITWDFFGGYVLRPYDGGVLDATHVAVDTYGNSAAIVNKVPVLTIRVVPLNPVHVSGTVPSITGLTEAAATTAITNAGLVAVSSHVSTPYYAKGAVINTTPAVGTVLPVGSTVTLIVSLGASED